VLLVHGFGTSSFVWRAVAPTLAESGMTAYAVDLLGYGESDRPRDADVGIAAQAEYLDRLMTALRIPKATVVGVDLGGSVALRLSAIHPDRVARLILVSPLAFEALPGDDIRTMQRSTARHALRLTRGVFGAAPLLAPLLRGAVSDEVHMPPRLVGRYLAPYVGREGVEQLLALARSIRVDDLADVDLAEVRAPTLVVWGDGDRSMTAELPERLSSAIPNCRALRVPGAGRLIPEEAPSALARVIVDFVGALRGPAQRPDPAQTA
jgi:pimeloyl-ACP methyl ester carboxylesterase